MDLLNLLAIEEVKLGFQAILGSAKVIYLLKYLEKRSKEFDGNYSDDLNSDCDEELDKDSRGLLKILERDSNDYNSFSNY